MSNKKRVLSSNTGGWIQCAWFECDKDGFELHKSVFHEHARDLPCDHQLAGHVNFVFCSERHRQLYRHSHVDLWNLPPGFKSVF